VWLNKELKKEKGARKERKETAMKRDDGELEGSIGVDGSGEDHAVEPMPRGAKIFWSCFALGLFAAGGGAVYFFS
jgi:hypothetical protein